MLHSACWGVGDWLYRDADGSPQDQQTPQALEPLGTAALCCNGLKPGSEARVLGLETQCLEISAALRGSVFSRGKQST